MERCPNCGASARPSAKFCTTCGYRFDDDTAGANASMNTSSSGENAASGATGPTSNEAPGGWPSSANNEWNRPESVWAPPPLPETPTSVAGPAQVETMTWQQGATAGWPAPREEEIDVAATVESPANESPPDD